MSVRFVRKVSSMKSNVTNAVPTISIRRISQCVRLISVPRMSPRFAISFPHGIVLTRGEAIKCDGVQPGNAPQILVPGASGSRGGGRGSRLLAAAPFGDERERAVGLEHADQHLSEIADTLQRASSLISSSVSRSMLEICRRIFPSRITTTGRPSVTVDSRWKRKPM